MARTGAGSQGSIRDRLLAEEHLAWRGFFWRDVTAKLDTLDLTLADRARIEAGLLAVVPRVCGRS
jgi:hypothetical protein